MCFFTIGIFKYGYALKLVYISVCIYFVCICMCIQAVCIYTYIQFCVCTYIRIYTYILLYLFSFWWFLVIRLLKPSSSFQPNQMCVNLVLSILNICILVKTNIKQIKQKKKNIGQIRPQFLVDNTYSRKLIDFQSLQFGKADDYTCCYKKHNCFEIKRCYCFQGLVSKHFHDCFLQSRLNNYSQNTFNLIFTYLSQPSFSLNVFGVICHSGSKLKQRGLVVKL